jgi:methylated-DNA-protein-cysteine methyltransferase related protein
VDLDASRARLVLSRVRSVPAGFVTTYGDLSPGAPRFAGAVLAACDDPGVPWQRIVRADGSLAKGERQRRLLAAEGVPFRGDRVDMHVAWVPVHEEPARPRPGDDDVGRQPQRPTPGRRIRQSRA